jgi:transposase
MGKCYSSDVSDKEWCVIESVLNKHKGLSGRPPPRDARMLWNAMFYVTKNVCFWRDIPHDFGDWKGVYNYFNRLKHRGVLDEVMDETRTRLRVAEGRESSPSMGIIDSQSVKSRSFKK